MNMRLALTAAIGLVLGTCSIVSAKMTRNWNDLSTGPRVIRYDLDKDELVHQHSVVSAATRARPGGEHAYSGNRLETFQFHGKRGRGGIYDALQDYKLKFDPRKYQYRRR